MPTLTCTIVKAALKSQSLWDFSNGILYKLCHDFPEHTKEEIIIAKTMTIGRVYAAQLERRRHADQTVKVSSDDFYRKVAQKFKKSDIDKWLRELHQHSVIDPYFSIKVHKKLTDFLHGLTEMENRSFASKYLHFHCQNLFFIYDKRASDSIRELTMPERKRRALNNLSEMDTEYAGFFLRCMRLTQQIGEMTGRIPCPRELDKVLLHWHERYLIT
jgi:hypothetical protein